MREIYKARQFCHFHKRVVYHSGISTVVYMELLRYIYAYVYRRSEMFSIKNNFLIQLNYHHETRLIAYIYKII